MQSAGQTQANDGEGLVEPLARLRQLGTSGDDNALIFRDRTPKGRHYTA